MMLIELEQLLRIFAYRFYWISEQAAIQFMGWIRGSVTLWKEPREIRSKESLFETVSESLSDDFFPCGELVA